MSYNIILVSLCFDWHSGINNYVRIMNTSMNYSIIMYNIQKIKV